MPSSSGRGLHGPRPNPLKVSKDNLKSVRSPVTATGGSQDPPEGGQQGPVIIYVQPPKVVHTSPQEFRSVVQRLTGMDTSESERSPASGEASRSGTSDRGNGEKETEGKGEFEEDSLALTLGQSPSASAWNSSSSSASMASPAPFIYSPKSNDRSLVRYVDREAG